MWGYLDDTFRDELCGVGLDLTRISSPNFNVRAPGALVDTVVIHYTDLSLEDSLQHLTNPVTEAGTHLIIGREGTVFQLVPLAKRAWHAGRSCLYGRPDVNSSSVGIDLVFRPHTHDGYTDVQYEVLNTIIDSLMRMFPIHCHRITGHEHVALPLGRKKDPGPLFDWTRVRAVCLTR